MHQGRLYRSNQEQLVANVQYRLMSEAPSSLWGELVPMENGQISNGEDYIVELENKNKIKCNLRKNVNRGVIGIPPRFAYRFMGS